MTRALRTVLGLALIAVLFAWLVLRAEEPLSTWAASSTLLGWVFQGAAWLSCLAGVALLASAWPRTAQRID